MKNNQKFSSVRLCKCFTLIDYTFGNPHKEWIPKEFWSDGIIKGQGINNNINLFKKLLYVHEFMKLFNVILICKFTYKQMYFIIQQV